MTVGYLNEVLARDLYKVYYPAGQQDGKRVDCGNVWEVAYTKACRQQCCMCGQELRGDNVCPAARSQTWERTECANGQQPPNFEVGAIPSLPRLASVNGLALIDTKEGDVHFADPLPNVSPHRGTFPSDQR